METIISEHFWLWIVMADIVVTGAAYVVISKVFVAAVKGAMKPTEDKVDDLIQGQDDLKKIQTEHTTKLDSMGRQMMKIEYQVQPNSGRSLRDTANRTEAAVEVLDSKFDTLSDRVSRIEGGQSR